MEENNEIEVLEPSAKEFGRVLPQSGFSIAPPQLCQRWAQPTPSEPKRITSSRTLQRDNLYPQPIITKVQSLSPLKNQPIITEVKSLSPLKNQIPCKRTRTPFSSVSHLPSSPHPRPQPNSLSTLRRQNNSNGSPVSKPSIRVVPLHRLQGTKSKNGLKTPKSFECITLDDDDTDQSSSSENTVCQNSVDIKKEPVQAENTETNDFIRTLEEDCAYSDDSGEKKSVAQSETCDGISRVSSNADVIVSASPEEISPAHTSGDSEVSKDVQTVASPKMREDCLRGESSAPCSSKTNPSGIILPNNSNHPNKKNLKRKASSPKPKLDSEKVLNEFLDACLSADSSEDMSIILEKKIKKHYHNCDSAFVTSSSFAKLLQNFTAKVNKDKSNVYVYIAEVMGELKARKGQDDKDKKKNDAPAPKKSKIVKADEINYEEVEEERKATKIRQLSTTLKKLQNIIKDLEAKEVSWEDDGDSSYIMLQRYKDRAVKVFNKLCDLTKESKSAGKIIRIPFSGTSIPKVNKCVERYINTTGEFPDYVDILDVVKKANDEDNLKLPEMKIESIATEAFKSVGEELQRQRQHGVAESLLALLDEETDPADADEELAAKLQANKKNWGKINEVIDEFAARAKEKKGSDSGDSNRTEDEDDDEDEEEEEEEEENDDELLMPSSPDDENDESDADENCLDGEAESPKSVEPEVAKNSIEPLESDAKSSGGEKTSDLPMEAKHGREEKIVQNADSDDIGASSMSNSPMEGVETLCDDQTETG